MKKIKIKPIKTKKDYNAALKLIEELFDAEPNTPKGELLEVLSILVDKYEEEHFPIETPNPVDAIRFRMEQRGLSNVDLAPLIGGKNRVSEIFNGKRNLTTKMIKSLHLNLQIPPESLLGV